MQLVNDLYNIVSVSEENDGSYLFNVRLNPGHFIYKAHFPEEPITPGVCIIQIARELIHEVTSKAAEIKFVKNAKFLNIISPIKNPDITFHINRVKFEENVIKAQVTVTDLEKTFSKLSLVLAQ